MTSMACMTASRGISSILILVLLASCGGIHALSDECQKHMCREPGASTATEDEATCNALRVEGYDCTWETTYGACYGRVCTSPEYTACFAEAYPDWKNCNCDDVSWCPPGTTRTSQNGKPLSYGRNWTIIFLLLSLTLYGSAILVRRSCFGCCGCCSCCCRFKDGPDRTLCQNKNFITGLLLVFALPPTFLTFHVIVHYRVVFGIKHGATVSRTGYAIFALVLVATVAWCFACCVCPKDIFCSCFCAEGGGKNDDQIQVVQVAPATAIAAATTTTTATPATTTANIERAAAAAEQSSPAREPPARSLTRRSKTKRSVLRRTSSTGSTGTRRSLLEARPKKAADGRRPSVAGQVRPSIAGQRRVSVMARLEEYKKRRPSWKVKHPELASRIVKRKRKGKKSVRRGHHRSRRKKKKKGSKTKELQTLVEDDIDDSIVASVGGGEEREEDREDPGGGGGDRSDSSEDERLPSGLFDLEEGQTEGHAHHVKRKKKKLGQKTYTAGGNFHMSHSM